MDYPPFCCIITLVFLLQLFSSSATVQRLKLRKAELFSDHSPRHQVPPTEFFEVSKPIDVPSVKPCIVNVLKHDFAYSYNKSPVLADYSPPSTCSFHKFSKIVLNLKATCRGRQFDRIFGVWLSGVELLRSCTAEPRPTGILWKVEKDVTRYYTLLSQNQTLAVYLGNLLDRIHTGVYHVKIKFHFYPLQEKFSVHGSRSEHAPPGFTSWADKIIPISRNLPVNDGLWFQIQNSTDVESKKVEIPRNTYRAVLEMYVSFHENDEFWYSNPSNNYIEINNLTGTPGNGPFREVLVTLDGEVIGASWPFTVIYTGGLNPLLWRPITGIGSFNLPSYDIEVTPFLGKLLDGKSHKFGFRVSNGLNVWFVCANLHLWLDHKRKETKGRLVDHSNLPPLTTTISDFDGLNGVLLSTATRSISAVGSVSSSHGKIITYFSQEFSFNNSMIFADNGSKQIVNQIIRINDSVVARTSSSTYMMRSFKRFPLFLHLKDIDQGNHTYTSLSNVSLGFEEEKIKGFHNHISSSSLKNLQMGMGKMVVKGNLVRSGWGATRQVYDYERENDCYFRDVRSFNYTILHDVSGNTCNERRKLEANSSSHKSPYLFDHRAMY